MKRVFFEMRIFAIAAPFKIGLVTEVGGIDDKSYSQGAWAGVKQFAEHEGSFFGGRGRDDTGREVA